MQSTAHANEIADTCGHMEQSNEPFTPPRAEAIMGPLQIRTPGDKGGEDYDGGFHGKLDHIEQLFQQSTPALQRAKSVGSDYFLASPPVYPQDSMSSESAEGFSLHDFVTSEDHEGLKSELERLKEMKTVQRRKSLLNEKDQQSFTPLILAAAAQQSESSRICLHLLIDAGASLESKDKEGFTALHWAAACGDADKVKLLLDSGANINERSETFETPLHRACRLGRVPSIITLLDEGADIKAPNKEFMQPLDVAGIFQGDVCFPRRKDSVSTICAKYPSMRTMVIHHEDFLLHKPKEEHQEHSQRASFVLNRLASAAYADQGSSLAKDREDIKAICNLYPLESPEVSFSNNPPKTKAKWANVPELECIWPYKWCKAGVAGVYADSFFFNNDFNAVSWEQVQLAHSKRYIRLVRSLDEHVKSRENPVPFTPVVQRGVQRTSLNDLKQPKHSDTYFSSGTLKAALRAGGAVCHAVDQVLQGSCRNAFCVVRPPGHHAGESGLINDGESFLSCGFCVFNNIAIGALHALNRVANPKPQKVAIVDFDVHHGNGTEEIVKKYIQRTGDIDSLFFFSVHLWDETQDCDTFKTTVDPETPENGNGNSSSDNQKPVKRRRRVKSFGDDYECELPAGSDVPRPESCVSQTSAHTSSDTATPAPKEPNAHAPVEDDVDSDAYKATRFYPGSGLRDDIFGNIINCPIRPLWRTDVQYPKSPDNVATDALCRGRQGVRAAIKRRLLPALRAYNPDLILISAGFDGGRGDAGNLSSDGTKGGLDLTAEDYEWMMSQIMRVSRICCPGRVVSVMEGGYGEWKMMEGVFTDEADKKGLSPYLKRNNLAENCIRHFQSILLNGSRPQK